MTATSTCQTQILLEAMLEVNFSSRHYTIMCVYMFQEGASGGEWERKGGTIPIREYQFEVQVERSNFEVWERQVHGSRELMTDSDARHTISRLL